VTTVLTGFRASQVNPSRHRPHRAVPDQAEEAEVIDLLGTAGMPVLKRALPLAFGLLVLVLVISRLRRHR
jgi:uncharacterized protein